MECLTGYIKVPSTANFFIPNYLFTVTLVSTEEVFKSQKAVWSSNDGSLLLYATFNDTNVGQMNYPWFSSNKLVLQAGEIVEMDYFANFVEFLRACSASVD